MKKIFLMFVIVLIFFVLSICIVQSISTKETEEEVKPLSDIVIYCNTKEFVHNMVSNSYHMQIAAKGSVNDEHHRDLMETQLWINSNNNQWSIVFVYKNVDKSCILGGNDMELYSPSEIKE